MIATPTCLFEATLASSSDVTVYTAPTLTTTIIDKMTATNTDGSTRTLNVNLIQSGGSVGSGNLIIKALSLSAGATVDITQIQNQILNTGDQISIKADSASVVVVRGSGRQCV